MERSFSGEGVLHRRYPSKGEKSDVMSTPGEGISPDLRSFLRGKLESVLTEPFELEFTFHKNFTPYWLHTDAGYEKEPIYKQGIIPLVVEPQGSEVYTVIMDQRCTESSGFDGTESNVTGWVESGEPLESIERYWEPTEIRMQALKKMSIHTPFLWKVGDTVIWDRSMIHGSSDFSKSGVEYKIGLMWISRFQG